MRRISLDEKVLPSVKLLPMIDLSTVVGGVGGTMNRLALNAAAAAAMMLCAHAADATLVTITYTGTIASGLDTTGLFGARNTDLAMAKFTTEYLVDTSIGQTSGPRPGEWVVGGSDTGTASPILSVKITVNGITYTSDANTHGEVHDIAEDHYSQQLIAARHFFVDSNGSSYSDISNYLYDGRPFYPFSFDSPFSADVTTPQTGYFRIIANIFADPSKDIFAEGYMNTEHLEIALVSDTTMVPEPTSWAMFIGGFGLIGAAMRRRRQTTVRFA